jgi:hypothetical protein
MQQSIMPNTFDQWRHCIHVDCGIELTKDYIASRIASLNNEKEHYTQQFIKLYGRSHWQQTLAWFEQASKL